MAAHAKAARQFAGQLFSLSLEDGAVAPERVAGVLAYLERHRPANPLMVLKAYHRLVAAALARGQAVVEHAGAVPDEMLRTIADSMTRRYGRPIASQARPNPALLAGLRVRVGDDVYEASAAGRLAALAAG